MSPTSCRCSTPRRPGPVPGPGSLVLSRCPGPPVSRGPGAPAAASPPVGSPPQYSPALRWVTTGFGMGPGGASALSATGAPDPPSVGPGGAALSSSRYVVVCPTAWERTGWGDGLPPGRAPAPGSCPGGRGPRPQGRAGPPQAACDGIWVGVCRSGPESRRGSCAVPVPPARWSDWGDRPRPSARLGSGRLPAVHPPPVNPVVSRGPYPQSVGRLVLGRGSRLDAFSG